MKIFLLFTSSDPNYIKKHILYSFFKTLPMGIFLLHYSDSSQSLQCFHKWGKTREKLLFKAQTVEWPWRPRSQGSSQWTVITIRPSKMGHFQLHLHIPWLHCVELENKRSLGFLKLLRIQSIFLKSLWTLILSMVPGLNFRWYLKAT